MDLRNSELERLKREMDEMWKLHVGSKQYVREGLKIGRNDMCLCGSGIKHKRCCFRKNIVVHGIV